MAEFNVKDAIKELVDTNWSKDNSTQGKAVQLLKGLSFSDDPLANKFMEYMDNCATKFKMNTEESKEESGDKLIEQSEYWTSID